jgi:hypothetical protein
MDYIGEQQSIFLSGSSEPGTVDNNYVVNVTPAPEALSDNLMLVFTPDADNLDTIVSQSFTGTGPNDGVYTGPYVGSTAGSVFTSQIDGVVVDPPEAPTAVLSGTAGVVTAGVHKVAVTFVTAEGETTIGAASDGVTADGAHKIDVSSIPCGAAGKGVIARKVHDQSRGLYLLLRRHN